MEFADVPSVVVQAAILEQVLIDKEQNRPVDMVQSVVPHVQSMEFVSLPSIIVQTATFEQVLVEETQKRPVDVEQVVVPQVQSLSFTDKPLLLVHEGGIAVQRFSEA